MKQISLIATQMLKNSNKRKEEKKLQDSNDKELANEQELKRIAKANTQKEEKRALIDLEIKYQEDGVKKTLRSISELESPVVCNFNSDFETASLKYYKLKAEIENTHTRLLGTRASVLSYWQILALKASVAMLFIVIIMRLIGDNILLLESFTYVMLFQYLFDGITALVLDFLIQDIILISSISLAISLLFKDSDYMYSKDVTKHSLYVFLGAVVGLFISSVLYGI